MSYHEFHPDTVSELRNSLAATRRALEDHKRNRDRELEKARATSRDIADCERAIRDTRALLRMADPDNADAYDDVDQGPDRESHLQGWRDFVEFLEMNPSVGVPRWESVSPDGPHSRTSTNADRRAHVNEYAALFGVSPEVGGHYYSVESAWFGDHTVHMRVQVQLDPEPQPEPKPQPSGECRDERIRSVA